MLFYTKIIMCAPDERIKKNNKYVGILIFNSRLLPFLLRAREIFRKTIKKTNSFTTLMTSVFYFFFFFKPLRLVLDEIILLFVELQRRANVCVPQVT